MRGTSSNIVFKMYNIPVRIGNFQKADTTGLKQGSPCCNDLVGRNLVCKSCEKPVEFSELTKIFQIGNENHVFTKEQIEALKDFDDVIEVLGSIDKSSIDYRMVCGAFAVFPDKKQKKKQVKMFEKAYKVFERSVAESDKAIVVKFSTRQKQKLGIMTSIDNVLTLLHIVYEEQFNKVDSNDLPEIEISDAEKKQGTIFIESLEPINVLEIENDFKLKLEELVENGTPVALAPEIAHNEEELGFFKQ